MITALTMLPVRLPMPPSTTMTTTKVELSIDPFVNEKLTVERVEFEQA